MSDAGPGTLTLPDGCHAVEGRASDQDVAVVASRYNSEVVQRLLDGAVERLMERGIAADRITVVLVPGAWELPLACRRLAEAGSHQAVVALGCVIRGGTPHFDYVCSEASRGRQQGRRRRRRGARDGGPPARAAARQPPVGR